MARIPHSCSVRQECGIQKPQILAKQTTLGVHQIQKARILATPEPERGRQNEQHDI